MGKKKNTVIYLLALAIICGLIAWHAVLWHLNGMYLEMFDWLEAGQGYITVLYNLGLMLVLGTALGLLLDKIADLIGYGAGKKQ